MKLGFKLTLILSLFLFQTTFSHAAEMTPPPEFELGEVVVSAPKPAVSERVATVQEVTAEEIKESNARTLNEAIDLLPGVHVRVGGDGTPRIDIRGMRTRQVILLLDGVPLNSTYDNQFDPTLIPTENIARIKVVRGASSVLYGPGGNAGVINIITKKGSPGISGFLNGELGEVRSALVRGGINGGSESIQAFASGSWYKTDGFNMSGDFDVVDPVLEDGDLRDNSDRERTNGYANIIWTPGDATRIGFSAFASEAERGAPWIVYSDKFTKKPKFERANTDKNISLQLSGSHDFDGPISMRAWVFMNQYHEDTWRYDDETLSSQKKKGAFFQNFETSISGAAAQVAYDLDRFGLLTLAGSYTLQSWDGYLDQIKDNGDPFTRVVDEDVDIDVYSGSLEYSVEPIDGLGLVAGVGLHQQDKEDAGEETEYSYMVGATYQLFETTTLRANHARKVRFPSLKELYDGDDSNPDLEAEVGTHYEVGVDQEIPVLNGSISASAFILEAEDFIEKIDDQRINNDEYLFQGVELWAGIHPADGLDLSASYTYLHSENETDGRPSTLQNRPRHKATIQGSYRFPTNTKFYLAYHRVWDTWDLGGDDTRRKLEEGHVFNLKLTQTIYGDGLLEDGLTDDLAMDLYLGVDNLFDADYEWTVALPAPGRTVHGGVGIRF